MMMELRSQASKFGCEIIDKNVDSVDLSERPFKVTVGNEQSAGTSRAGRTFVFVVLALLMAIPIGLSLVRWRAGRRREAAP